MELKVLLEWTKRLWNFILFIHVWMIVYCLWIQSGQTCWERAHHNCCIPASICLCIVNIVFSKIGAETVQMVWNWHELKHCTSNTERNYFQFYLKSIRTTSDLVRTQMSNQNSVPSIGYNVESTTIFMVKYCKLNVPA